MRELLGGSVSEDMQTVALNFIKLQEARHGADYDLDFQFSSAQAREFVTMALNAIRAWDWLAPSAEPNIFVLSLFLWKKWDVVRP